MNIYNSLPLSLLGQQPMQRAVPSQDLQSLGMSSSPEWQWQPNANTQGNVFNMPEMQPSGAYPPMRIDPNDTMALSVWQNLYGRQIGGGWGL